MKIQDLLNLIADKLQSNQNEILEENQKDLDRMNDEDPKKDRLLLNSERIQDLVKNLHDVAQLEDPTGKVLSEYVTGEGINIQRIT